MEQLTLAPDEELALNLLRNTPGEIQKVVRPDGTIGLNDLHRYFSRLSYRLEFIQGRRRADYIDIEHKKEEL